MTAAAADDRDGWVLAVHALTWNGCGGGGNGDGSGGGGDGGGGGSGRSGGRGGGRRRRRRWPAEVGLQVMPDRLSRSAVACRAWEPGWVLFSAEAVRLAPPSYPPWQDGGCWSWGRARGPLPLPWSWAPSCIKCVSHVIEPLGTP